MTDAQFVIILGAVWLAPHLHKNYGLFAGAFLTTIGGLRIWGLI